MITDLEMAYGDQMDAAVARGVERLDIASDSWAERVESDIMFMQEINTCLLAQAFGSYKAGLDFLGIDSGEEYGFDIPNDIYDIHAQYEAYAILAEKWGVVIEDRTQG